MDRKHQDLIRSNKFVLQQKLHIDELLLAHLSESRVITEGMQQEIEAKATRTGKANYLLSLLPKRGQNAFKVFLEALVITDQDHLADLLDPDHSLVSHNEQETKMKLSPSLEVSRKAEENCASGGVDKEMESAPKKEVAPGEASPETSENTNKVSLFPENESPFIKIEMKTTDKCTHCQPKFINKGRLIIINNNQLRENKDGSTFDSINLLELFKKLEFSVLLKENLTCVQMKQMLEKECKECDGFDGLVLCIMGRGGCGNVCGTDGNAISIAELKEYFNDVKCPTLKGKPKICISETCMEKGEKCSEQQSLGNDVVDHTGMENLSISSSCKIEMHCTITGYETARDANLGSWFIRTLVKTIRASVHQDDVVTMLREVRRLWTNTNIVDMTITVNPEKSDVYFHSKSAT